MFPPPVNYVVNEEGKPVFVQLALKDWEIFLEDYKRLKNISLFKEKFKVISKEIQEIQKGKVKGTTFTDFMDEL